MKKQQTLNDIAFDKEDALLFSYSDDLLLKAKAIQNSILPKLQVLLQESISLIRKIYGIEVFDENSHIEYSPHFREKRENSLQLNYDYALMGISGGRIPVWTALKRDDNRPVKIIPIHFQYEFLTEGLFLVLYIDDSIELSVPSFQKLFSVLVENIETIVSVANYFSFHISFSYDEKDLFSSVAKQIKNLAKSSDKYFFYFCIKKDFTLPNRARRD
ncbi:MAG: hypothetical protein J1D88_04825 [Treponema sp.]|nr:hypothetical protein [Treponema sp.]